MGTAKDKHKHHKHAHHDHDHSPMIVDKAFESHKLGIKTLQRTLLIYMVTAVFQFIIAVNSRSVALLADTIHNFADAFTSIPLWIAFILARRKPSKRFTYGFGKTEDVAGIMIVVVIFISAGLAFYEAVHKIIHPEPMDHMGWVAAAAIIGFFGNEIVAEIRIKAGKKIGSAVMIADGYHARTDGFTSLAVLIGVVGTYFNMPIIDPLVGIGITIAILFIVKETVTVVLVRLIDGIDPEVVDEIEKIVQSVPGIKSVEKVRARWTGHHITTEIEVGVAPSLTVHEADHIAKEIREKLMIAIDPLNSAFICINSVHR